MTSTITTLTQTQKQYESAYRVLQKMTGKSMDDIINTPEETYETLTTYEYKEGKRYDVKSIKNMLTAIMKYIKVLGSGNVTQKHQTNYLKYLSYFNQSKATVQSNYNKNVPSDKQKDGIIPWSDVIKKRDELSKTEYGSRRHLLLSMYSYIPPLRQDFNSVEILRRKPRNYRVNGLDLTLWPKSPEMTLKNFIVLNRQTQKLVMNEYKTATHYGMFETVLPPDLVNVIEASLKQHPRYFLFCDMEGKAYSAGSFTWFSNSTLKELFGNKNISVSMLRHSYISSQDYNKMSETERQKMASSMLHSVQEQGIYRKIQ